MRNGSPRSGRVRPAPALLATALLLCGGAGLAEPKPPGPAAEGTALIEALEGSPLGVVGVVEEPRALDAKSWRASVAVDTALGGGVPAGQRVVIAWEELVASRPPRFTAGERVLVALEPLVAGSLWRQRFADPRELARVYGIADRGTAFLRTPSAESVSLLEHFLLLPHDVRDGPTGQRHLAALAADAERPLALSAARRLATTSGGSFGAEEAALLLRALARAERDPELATSLLGWIERGQPEGLAPALDAALADPERAPASFVRARGRLGTGLPAELERRALASPSAALRAAAAEVAGPAQAGRLAHLLREDKVPAVRLAALGRVGRLDAAGNLDALLAAFSDGDPAVRSAAALQVAALGPEVVPRLRDASHWPWPGSESAVIALQHTSGEEARAALVSLSEEHPDERVRTLARLAIGRPLGHKD